ncbi:hypothetical protein DEU29_104191 [Idiomarina aquatica]|uniref:Uncharacterized protein n=2 Tax=Idiomarina aquatica TaxID=1327752 RepID=A0A4R6PQ58_9GAMM|nr:hypothetical protein DEU29_104191 [Idiomarina aquatica]
MTRMSRQRGFVLISLTLFSLLLAAQWLHIAMQQRQLQWLALMNFTDEIVDRRHLIRALALQLERMPNAQELELSQQASGIVWSFVIDDTTAASLRWRLFIPRRAWAERIVGRSGGEIDGSFWVSTETSPIT